MKVEREKLENEIYKAIGDFILDTKVKEEVRNNMAIYNIPAGEVSAIFARQIAIETVDLSILLLFTKYLYQATDKTTLNPENYFTELEMQEAKNYKREIIKNITKEVILEDAIQVGSDQWVTVLSAQQLSQLYSAGRIYYNPLTQRGMRATKSGDTIIQKIDIRDSAVKEISKKMLNNSYISNTITLNILKDGNDEYDYNEKTNKLSIGENAEIDVVDGFHRSYAILRALSVNHDLNLSMEIRIVNWDIEKARRFIYQEDLRTPIRKDYKTSLDETDFNNIIVKELNEKSKNELQFKIATDMNLIKYNQAYTLFETMSQAIDICFETKSQREANKTSEYLIEFFNEVIGIMKDKFDNLAKSKEVNASVQPNTFIGYIGLAAELQDRENWKTRLEDILNNVDFDLNNEVWKELEITTTRLGKRGYNKIIKYFKEMIKNVRQVAI